MSDLRITELNELTTLVNADELLVSDTSTSETKKISVANFKTNVAGSAHTVQNNGTGLTQRANLNFDGTHVVATDDSGNNQTDVALSANLQAVSGLTSAANKGIQFSGSGTAATFDLTTAGKALLDDANTTAQRSTLGLGALAVEAAVTTSLMAAGTLVIASETIGSNNNDTTIPTSAAVKAYADSVGGSGNKFSTIAVAGQSNVVADAATDTLTLAAGSNVTLTTNAGTDTVTIASSGGGGGSKHVIQSAGTGIAARTNLNFDGTKLVATDDSGNDQTDITLGSSVVITTDSQTLTNKSVFGKLSGTSDQGTTKTITVTVASKTSAHPNSGGSSNAYFLDGIEASFLNLTQGTYKFDQADGTNSTHPLRFYLDDAKGTAFTTGVTTNGTAGSSGAYTQIVVDDTTPFTLSYQCSAHGYMGSYVHVGGTTTILGQTIDSDSNTITNIANADIKNAAAIALNKLAAATVSRALVSDGSGFVSAATTTAAEIGHVSGVTSAIQTQINAKQATISGSARIDAAHVHDGTITNTEYGYLNGVTSSIQTQLNAAGTTLTGLTDTGISSSAAGQALLYDGSNSYDNKQIKVMQHNSAFTTALPMIDSSHIYRVSGVSGSNHYVFENFESGGTDTNDPSLYLLCNHTYAFYLGWGSGHPFAIRTGGSTGSAGTNLVTGNGGDNLIHIATDGTVSTGTSANAKSTGWLIWQIPNFSAKQTASTGNYGYQCTSHPNMFGQIYIGRVQDLYGSW